MRFTVLLKGHDVSNEPRDERGRWTEGSALPSQSEARENPQHYPLSVYMKVMEGTTGPNRLKSAHRSAVEARQSASGDVSPDVMADYPDILANYPYRTAKKKAPARTNPAEFTLTNHRGETVTAKNTTPRSRKESEKLLSEFGLNLPTVVHSLGGGYLVSETGEPLNVEFEANVQTGRRHGDKFRITLKFGDSGSIGQRTVEIYAGEDDDGRPTMFINREMFNLAGSSQNKGIAARSDMAVMEIAKRIARHTTHRVCIYMHANLAIGGYAWASYKFSSDLERSALYNHMVRHADTLKASGDMTDADHKDVIRQLKSLKRRKADPVEFSQIESPSKSEYHAATLSSEVRAATTQVELEAYDRDTWRFGKAGMLGSSWYGQRFIAADGTIEKALSASKPGENPRNQSPEPFDYGHLLLDDEIEEQIEEAIKKEEEKLGRPMTADERYNAYMRELLKRGEASIEKAMDVSAGNVRTGAILTMYGGGLVGGRLVVMGRNAARFQRLIRNAPAATRVRPHILQKAYASGVIIPQPPPWYVLLKAHDVSNEPRDTKGRWARLKYSQEQIAEAIRLYDSGKSLRQVAEAVGIPYGSIGSALRNNGYKARNKSDAATKNDPDMEKKVVEYAARGYRWEDITRDLGVSKIRARRILRERGLQKIPADKGLGQAIKQEVVRLYVDEQLSTPRIAKQLGIAEKSAAQIVRAAGVARSPSERTALALQMRLDEGKRVGKSGISAPYYSPKNDQWHFADSSYELVRMSQLDSDERVVKWERPAPTVIYDNKRRYVPDFLVHYRDYKEVEEVKPVWQQKEPDVQAKADAARKFFAAQGISYRLLNEHDIGLDALEKFDYDSLPFVSDETLKRLKTAARQVRVARWMLTKQGNELEKSYAAGCWSDPASCGLRWITAHPNGGDDKGVPLLVHDDGSHYTVVGGAGGSMNQTVFKKPADHEQHAKTVAAAKRQERRVARQQERLKMLGDQGKVLQEKQQAYKEEANKQLTDLHNRVLEALHGEFSGNVLDKVKEEARKKALVEKGDASEAEQNEFADKAGAEAVKGAKEEAKKVLAAALDAAAKKAMGDESETPQEFAAKIGEKRVVRKFTDDQLTDFVKAAADIAALRGRAKAIARALSSGDLGTVEGIESTLKPISQEEATAQNLARFSTERDVDTQTALVKGSLTGSPINQKRNQANGAADGFNNFAASFTGDAILSPEAIRTLGVENAARVTAAYLQQQGIDTKATGDEMRQRIATQSTASAAAVIHRCMEMDSLVKTAKEAADSGDGSVLPAQASIIAANMAATKYRMLNTTRGQLRAAAALAYHLQNPSKRALRVKVSDTSIGAHAFAKNLGLKDGEFSIEKAQRGEGGGYMLNVKAEHVHRMVKPHTLVEAERNTAMDQLRQEVQENPGSWKADGFGYGNEKKLANGRVVQANLQPHHELAARSIIDHKRMLLNYGAGSGKTSIYYAAAGHLLENGHVDKVLMTMPAKPRAQQAGPQGEASFFLKPELARQVAVVQNGNDLKRQLKRLAAGEVKILIMSPHLMREKVADLKKAGFGGEKSAFFADEAHEFAIGHGEGGGSGMAQAAREMSNSEYMAAGSGTLIENNASELHSLYDMVHPGQLGSQRQFTQEWQRLSQGHASLFGSESMRTMRDRLSGGMVTYHEKVKSPEGGEVSLERNTRVVKLAPEQKKAISEVNKKFKEERQHEDPAISKAAALRRDMRVRRIINSGVKGSDGQQINPKLEAVKEILADEKKRDPKNRIGVYAFEKAPLKAVAGSVEGGKFATITGDDDDKATAASIKKVNDRDGTDLDGVLLSNAANYGVNLQGMDHLVKMHPLDVPSKEDQLDHRHYRTGQTRDVRATTLVADHPAEMMAQYRTSQIKAPEVALLAMLSDDSGVSHVLAKNYQAIKQIAAGG